MRDALLWNFKLVFLVCYEDIGHMVKLPGILPFGLSQHPLVTDAEGEIKINQKDCTTRNTGKAYRAEVLQEVNHHQQPLRWLTGWWLIPRRASPAIRRIPVYGLPG